MTGPAIYTFNFSLAEATVQNMGVITNDIQTELTTLDENVQRRFVEGEVPWEDEVQVHYRARQTEWNNAAVQLPANLLKAQNALINISDEYRSGEVRGSALWQVGGRP